MTNNRLLLLMSFILAFTFGNAQDADLAISELGEWISSSDAEFSDEVEMYANHPESLFRREFVAEHRIKKATLLITAAGYYQASLNGERIGDVYLDPAWTDFSKRIYYSEFDLTEKIKKGENCLGVTIGNGFYNPLPMRMWGNLNLRNALTTGLPAFTAKLKLEYKNGKTKEIFTDDNWKFAYGPRLKNNVYLGEWYDARWEKKGWNSTGYNDSDWNTVSVVESPGGSLLPRFFPPIKITEKLSPVKVTRQENGLQMVDMGVNFAGTYKIRLKGKTGDTVSFRFGERIYDDGTLNPMTSVCGQIKREGTGGPGAPDIAWQADTYVFGEDQDIWYSPEFTFHTFRYMEISGLSYPLSVDDLQGLALNTAVEESNRFECSSDLLNKIQEISIRTFKSNLQGVQSDCPARERFGYGGDINAVAESFLYNFDMHTFYRKVILDWVDAMNDSSFVDTAPFVGLKYCGISWESAFLFLQDELLKNYNDTGIVRELYQLDLKWMEKADRLIPGLIVTEGLGDHESLIPVPVQITGTCHYLKAAKVMKEFAGLMNDRINEEKFAKLESAIRNELYENFWRNTDADLTKVNKQTLYAALLVSGVIPENEKQATVDSLVSAVNENGHGHFTTGIFGTYFILEALSQAGLSQMVFDIVNSPEFPGWGYMVENGATTLWETWKESDNVYSNCHPMFGSVSGWFFRWLGGIQQDANSIGYQHLYLVPQTPEGLSFVKTSYRTPYGFVRLEWNRKSNGDVVYKLTVPKGAKAVFKTKVDEHTKITILNGSKVKIPELNLADGFYLQNLDFGEYEIVKSR